MLELLQLRLAAGVLATLSSMTAGGTTAWAANLVTNGSFEANGGSFQDWTITGTYGSGPGNGPQIITTNGVTSNLFGDVIKADPFTSSPDASGTHAAYFVDDNANEQLQEVIAVTAGVTYDVGFDYYLTGSGFSNPGPFSLAATLGSQAITTASSTQGSQAGTWYHAFSTYTAPVTGTVAYAFNFTSGNTYSKDVVVDDVYVKVPEPPSVPILALMLGLLGLVKRRRLPSA